MRQAKVLIPISVLFIASIIIIIILTRNHDDDVIINQAYCDTYPDALVCTEDYVSEYEVVEDMFQRLLIVGDGTIDDLFCSNHFYGKVESYCLDEDIDILPDDFYRLSRLIGIIPKGDGQYTITTKYYDKSPGYEFYISLVVEDGIYRFSGFSYAFSDPEVDLELEQSTLETYFEDMISDYSDADICRSYFIEEAYYDCLEDKEEILPTEILPSNYTITEITTNTYLYDFEDTASNTRYRITYYYKEVAGVLRINDVNVIALDLS